MSPSEREKEKAVHTKLLMQLENTAEPKLYSLLKEVANVAADNYAITSNVSSVSLITVEYQLKLAKILSNLYKSTADVFSSRIFDAVQGKKRNRIKLETKDAQFTFDLLLSEWIERNAFEQAQLITDTTRKDLVALILQAQQEDLDSSLIIRLIRDKLGNQISRSRAMTIARTEVHNAATFASLESSKVLNDDLDLGMKKIWLAVDDSRTRPEHNAVDDKTIDMDEDFIVGGARMSRPSDPRGGASQVINCRCALGYETEELD